VEPADGGDWLARWQDAGRRADQAVAAALAALDGVTEPGIARQVVAALPQESRLVLSSSMPIRDVEWYAVPRQDVEVHANRGANGIDGVVSTAIGLAAGDPSRPTALLIGDLALLHDSNALLGAVARGIDLVIVVVDNDGGGIFSFLPQADALSVEPFEQLYGTPHGLDLVPFVSAFGVPCARLTDVAAQVREAAAAGGVRVLVARTDRHTNVEVHRRVEAAVAAALAAVSDP
jgi:2-succinyl-5-enolpyruvyl-6-hydroxy-3-cyclohexene-1-carboxylate synthase